VAGRPGAARKSHPGARRARPQEDAHVRPHLEGAASDRRGWHADASLATLRLILAGTFDRHPDLQIILGHWGEMLVPFADRADLLSAASTHLER
jgi:predicted TIM-barrel fold metal-dependent hydrolase